LPGDFNLDDVVDAGDFLVWQAGLGMTYRSSDYNLWRANFGRQSAAIWAVPEPATACGALAALWALLAATRRR
jgi:hypothetical protein